MAEAAGIPWQGLAWTDPDKPSRGLQAAARAARYGLLSQAARTVGARVLMVGHTLDDSLENARMRATDTPGLGQLYPWRPVPVWPEGRGLMLCRPMLTLRRETLRDWLRSQGLSWIEDPANANPAFARVRARQALRSVADLIPDPTLSDQDLSTWLEAVIVDAAGTMTLRRTHMADLVAALGTGAALRALSAMVLCAAGQSKPPRLEGLMPILQLLQSTGSEAVRTLGGTQVRVTPETLTLCREWGRTRPLPLGVGAGETVIWDSRFQVSVLGAGTLVPAVGHLKALGPSDQARLRALTPMARQGLPVCLPDTGDGAYLPDVQFLGGMRLRFALGGIRRERDLWHPNTD